MANLTVQIINPPAGAEFWMFMVLDGMVSGGRGEVTDLLELNQAAQFDLPADWRFPAGIWVAVGQWTPEGAIRWIYAAQNFNPRLPDSYHPDIQMPGFGNYVFDCALDRFVVEPARPIGLWPWLVGGLVAIGLVVAHKKRGKW